MINRYAAGNKVYNSGSPVATAGHVDPTGYVERELRSRLAAQVLDGQGAGGQRLDRGAAGQQTLHPNQLGETAFRSPMGELARLLMARRRAGGQR